MTPTQQLLREFADNHSESAFRQLVDQYVDLVFSTALRRMGGDRHRAEDATQIVFTNLARKAKSLPNEVMLGGWLHRHCCFVVSNLRRTDSRRVAREKEAVAMENLHGPDANWSEIAPELDDAINALQEEDREAIVLRFFERQDFKAIGESLGGSENAAQKRVARALEKLRQLLAQRGVALSIAALMAGLASEAVASAPPALAEKACASALKSSASTPAAAAAATGSAALAFWSIAAAALIGIVTIGIAARGHTKAQRSAAAQTIARSISSGANTAGKSRPASKQSEKLTTGVAEAPNKSPESTEIEGPTLRLTLIAADTGNPIPNVPIEYRATEGTRWVNKNLQASRAGIALIPFTTNTTELRLITRTEAFADTRLFWQTKDAPIPTNYILRVKRGVQIGGKVTNSQGQLVPGAIINFGTSSDDPENAQKTESNEIGFSQLTAEDGTWQTTRITEPILRRMYVSARHPDYAGSEPPSMPMRGVEVDQLLKGKHVFRLRDGMTIRGIVVNKQDQPMLGAKVLVGTIHDADSREAIANSAGRFEISGCVPGKTMVTASAVGYAVTTLRVNTPPDDEYRIILEPGRLLKMRIADTNDMPIPKAYAWLKTREPDSQKSDLLAQADFEKRSDEQGLIEWNEAPADELFFDFEATGYMRKVDQKVLADGIEHTIVLLPALKISGTVRDAATGELIPKFRVIGGFPQSSMIPGETNLAIHWSTLDRHWLHGADGRFEKSWEEPIIYGVAENKYIFKIEADGYKSFLTRVVDETEREVTFDIALQSGPAKKLTILAPSGVPAVDADVRFVRHRYGRISVNGRGLEHPAGEMIASTDANGHVTVPNEDFVKVVAAGPFGFASIDPQNIGLEGTIQLEPWGHVKGRITRRGKGVADWHIRVGSNSQGFRLSITSSDTLTDADGNYSIDFAPPGQFDLLRMVRGADENTFFWIPLRDVEVTSGQTTTADYDNKGVAAGVRLSFPTDFVKTENTKIFCHGSSNVPSPTPEEVADPAALARWRKRPDIQELFAKAHHCDFHNSESDPGLWSFDTLAPGEWTISAAVMEEETNPQPGQSMPARLIGSITFHIPENSSDEKIDLGVITLQPPKSSIER